MGLGVENLVKLPWWQDTVLLVVGLSVPPSTHVPASCRPLDSVMQSGLHRVEGSGKPVLCHARRHWQGHACAQH